MPEIVKYVEAASEIVFGMDEINLMCIYDTGSRVGLMEELERALPDLNREEEELVVLVHQVIGKLGAMSDEAYRTLVLVPDWKE